MPKHITRISVAILLILAVLTSALVGCDTDSTTNVVVHSLQITNGDTVTLEVGYTVQLETDAPTEIHKGLSWATTSSCVTVDSTGFVTAKSVGTATVMVSYLSLSDKITIEVVEELPEQDGTTDTADTTETTAPDGNGTTDGNGTDTPSTPTTPTVDEAARDAFYGDSDPADSYAEAIARSQQGIISGALTVPDQAPTVSSYRPRVDGKYVRNRDAYFADQNTYVVLNANGLEVFRVYRGGGYITLEEVAAYVYAFGDVPANYTESKNTSPTESIWGEYLRLNHTYFSGNTSKYPYEPALPNISGCGGTYEYMEIDIGTTGTDCDPAYPTWIYNDGYEIVRGAARIVYARYDLNANRVLEPNERYVFYTYNHYNDFQEYLNYYGGWGEMFGNITGGGTISSRYDYNPTAYVETVLGRLGDSGRQDRSATVLYYDFRRLDDYLTAA